MTASIERRGYIRWFEEIGIEDVPLVGGKNASLGEMVRELTAEGIKVPNGFAVTAEAYWNLLRTSGLEQYIKDTNPSGYHVTEAVPALNWHEHAGDLSKQAPESAPIAPEAEPI